MFKNPENVWQKWPSAFFNIEYHHLPVPGMRILDRNVQNIKLDWTQWLFSTMVNRVKYFSSRISLFSLNFLYNFKIRWVDGYHKTNEKIKKGHYWYTFELKRQRNKSNIKAKLW